MSNSSSIDQTKVKSQTIEVQTSFATVSGISIDNCGIYGLFDWQQRLPTFRSNLSMHILWYCLPSDSLINRIYGGWDHCDILKSYHMSVVGCGGVRHSHDLSINLYFVGARVNLLHVYLIGVAQKLHGGTQIVYHANCLNKHLWHTFERCNGCRRHLARRWRTWLIRSTRNSQVFNGIFGVYLRARNPETSPGSFPKSFVFSSIV